MFIYFVDVSFVALRFILLAICFCFFYIFSAYCVLGGLHSAMFIFLPMSPRRLKSQYTCKPRGIKTHTKQTKLE